MKTKDFSAIKNNGPLPSSEDIQVPDDIDEFLNEYVDSTNSQLNELEQAALDYEAGNNSEENTATIRRILHKIKGESAMVGIDEITEFCHQTEDAFEELEQNSRSDMLLRFKDWTCNAIYNLASQA